MNNKKVLPENQKKVLECIEASDVVTALNVAKETGLSVEAVRRAVKALRTKFKERHPLVSKYVYITEKGYTVKESSESAAYEASFRYKLGWGTLINGSYVFERCKVLAGKDFETLKVLYKPKVNKVTKMFK